MPRSSTTGVVLCVSFWLATPATSIELQAFVLPSTSQPDNGSSEPSWSPDGEYIAYIGELNPDPTRYYGSTLRAASLHGAYLGWLPVDSEHGIRSLYGIASPTWSPDGRRIAYFASCPRSADCFGEPTGIWTVSESNAPALVLSRPNATWISCAWSPSGDAIAFAAQDSLWLVTVETGSVRRLTTSISSKPSWSPDGRSIVFSTLGDLRVIDVATSATRQLTIDESADRDPAWSPNGRWIAFASNRAGHSDLWVIPASGGEAIQLTDDEPMDDQPVWSPSGDRIAFRSSRNHPDSDQWMGGIWIASQLPDVLTEVVPRSWSTLKSSYR